MLKKCLGTKATKGCGEIKLDAEMSKSYKNLCKLCENTRTRNKYQRENHHNVQFLSEISRPWK